MARLETPRGAFDLERWPDDAPDLQGWDAADLYLLRHLAEAPPPDDGRLLVVNDAHGALAVALHAIGPVTWSDSYLSRLALTHNLGANGLAAGAVTFVPADTDPDGLFDLVLVKLPKSLVWLEDLLLRLRPHLAPGARVVLGGMIKHTPRRAYQAMERIIGPARTTDGWKKARLCTAAFDPERTLPAGVAEARYRLADPDLEITGAANVFSRDRLDPGTRLLLQYLPVDGDVTRAADLCCGAGGLALALARLRPSVRVTGVDESYQAVASARANAAAGGLADRVDFEVGDGLADVAAGSLDLVLCNPPFHAGHTVADHTALRLIRQAHAALRPGGELRLVGNRHLGHHAKMETVFGTCREVGTSNRFVVLSAVGQG